MALAPWLTPWVLARMGHRGPASLESSWLWTIFLYLHFKWHVQLLPKSLYNWGKFCPKQKLSRSLNHFLFYYCVCLNSNTGSMEEDMRRYVCKAKPEMQPSAVEGPLYWSHHSASGHVLMNMCTLDWCFVSQRNHSYWRRQLRRWLYWPSDKKQKPLAMIKRTWITLKASAPQAEAWGCSSIMMNSSGEKNISKWGWFSWGLESAGHSCPSIGPRRRTHTHTRTHARARTRAHTHTRLYKHPSDAHHPFEALKEKMQTYLPCSQAGHWFFFFLVC